MNYDTYEQKLFCLFVIDISSSVSKDIIREINKGLYLFHLKAKETRLGDCVEVGLMTYDEVSEMIQDPSLVYNFVMPTLSIATNSAGDVNKAVNAAIETINARKVWYKETGQPYYKPWIILINQSNIRIGPSYEDLLNRIHFGTSQKQYHFLQVDISDAFFNVHKWSTDEQVDFWQIHVNDIVPFFHKQLPNMLYHELFWDPELPCGMPLDI